LIHGRRSDASNSATSCPRDPAAWLGAMVAAAAILWLPRRAAASGGV